jgi:hypothetical protein
MCIANYAIGRTEIRTRMVGFKVPNANHYIIRPDINFSHHPTHNQEQLIHNHTTLLHHPPPNNKINMSLYRF